MRKLLLGVAATSTLLLATEVQADGLPERRVRQQYYQAPCANFSGFYLGGNLGSASYRADRNDQDAYLTGWAGFGPASYTATDTAFAGGVQGGFNLQRGCTLFGLEADWTWTDANAKTLLFPNTPGTNIYVNSALNNIGTLRTRTGLVVDNLLLYVTGGLAWANTDTTWRHYHGFGAHDVTNSFDERRWGWTAGLGTEYALGSHISLNAQALYVSLNETDHTRFLVPHAANFGLVHDDSAWVTRIGLNIRFGCGGAVC